MYFIYFIATCLLVTIVISVVVCKLRINTHKQKTKEYKEIINRNLKLEELKDFFLVLCDRSFDYIRVFFIFQGIAKAVNGLSLLFTVACLVLSIVGSFEAKVMSDKEWGILFSIISIVFVCIIIYINPTKRASQYLKCWRNTDKNIIKLISILQSNIVDDSISNYKELHELALKCADDLSNGEFEITSDEE
jgi:hypothetical protein